jgi:hypothetical protein
MDDADDEILIPDWVPGDPGPPQLDKFDKYTRWKNGRCPACGMWLAETACPLGDVLDVGCRCYGTVIAENIRVCGWCAPTMSDIDKQQLLVDIIHDRDRKEM